MGKDELDDRTIVVPRGEIDDATIVVPRDQLDDATIVVSRQVEDATISFSKPIEENTVTGVSGPQNLTKSSEESLPKAPTTEVKAAKIDEVEEDVELKIESYINPDDVLRKTKSQKISKSNIDLSVPMPKGQKTVISGSALHDAQKLMNKNKARSLSNSKVAVIAVFIGVALIGLTLAVLIK